MRSLADAVRCVLHGLHWVQSPASQPGSVARHGQMAFLGGARERERERERKTDRERERERQRERDGEREMERWKERDGERGIRRGK